MFADEISYGGLTHCIHVQLHRLIEIGVLAQLHWRMQLKAQWGDCENLPRKMAPAWGVANLHSSSLGRR